MNHRENDPEEHPKKSNKLKEDMNILRERKEINEIRTLIKINENRIQQKEKLKKSQTEMMLEMKIQ